jgi:arginyl-tRNA synthetase
LLGVAVEERGESFYNPMLSGVVEDLREGGLLKESDGAQVVFIEGAKVRFITPTLTHMRVSPSVSKVEKKNVSKVERAYYEVFVDHYSALIIGRG